MLLRKRDGVLFFVIVVLVVTATWVRAQQTAQSRSNSDFAVGVTLHYGAQVMVTDSEGRKSGYDPNTQQLVKSILGTSYYEDSITDATDDSSDPATSESKVLEIQTNTPQRYFVSVLPADASEYAIEFSCGGANTSRNHVSADEIPIESGDHDAFVVEASPACSSDSFVSGALKIENPSGASLLTYAYPSSNSVKIASGHPFRMVAVYSQWINPSSFTATLDGRTIVNLFKPKQNGIEGVNVPVSRGRHIIQLGASGTSGDGARLMSLDSFTVDVQ